MLLTVVTFIIVLGILVFIHEFGHFMMAKRMGIKIEEFGVGFPPKIWGKKFGETIYSINALPIGGFVRLYGEDEAEIDSKEKQLTNTQKRAFFAKKPWQRALVLLAGVFMNFLLGWLIISYVFTQGVMVPTNRVHIEEIAKGSPAEKASLEKGDVILKLKTENLNLKSLKTGNQQEIEIKTPKQLVETTDKFKGKEIVLVIERKGQILEKAITPREKSPADEGAMGVTISNYEKKIYPISKAPFLGLKEAFAMSKQLIEGLWLILFRLVTFQGVSRDVAGPIGIAELTGQAVRFGFGAVLELMGLLSLNLAVINLLPFPALDGGRLLFVVIEGISGKKVKPSWERYIHQIGMIILLALVVLASINDVIRIVGK